METATLSSIPTSLGYGDVHANNRVQSNPQLTQPNVNYLGFDITELDEDREILQFLEGTDDVSIEDATDLPSEGKKRKQAPEARKRRKRKRVRRMCTIEGCLNRVVQGGVCIAHGAKRKQCSFPGCDKSVKKAGLCSTHGPARKRCEVPGCSRVAVQGGICIGHGAKKTVCSRDGCSQSVFANSLCKSHSDESQPIACVPCTDKAVAPVATPSPPPVMQVQSVINEQQSVAVAKSAAPMMPSQAFQRTMQARAMSLFEEMMVEEECGIKIIGTPLPPPPPLHKQQINLQPISPQLGEDEIPYIMSKELQAEYNALDLPSIFDFEEF